MVIRDNQLAHHHLFTIQTEFLPADERVSLSYQRARLMIQTYRLSASDVLDCSPRYWAMVTDPILSLDTALVTILLSHIGLGIGTLSRHLHKRPDLQPLVDRLLRFDTVCLYQLTERGHGLDAFNIETTATKTAQGFVINTPREEACKFMPASTPSFGIDKVSLVMARLIVAGEDRGPRFFIVPICNEREMFEGVESIRLGPRSGTSPLDFSITRFNSVLVPHTALITSNLNDYAPPEFPLNAWWNEVWRIPIGTMAIVAHLIPSLKTCAFISAKYSMNRFLTGKGPKPVPIISFRTQQWPILHAVAVSLVMENWYSTVKVECINGSLDPRVRHAFSVVVKTTICRHVQRCMAEVSERCGAQGTFENNYMVRAENDVKGVVIAEGDVLTLCIRLFSELLLGRYRILLPREGESLLARHAVSLFEEGKAFLETLRGEHRNPEFEAFILPQAEHAIEAMGHAMAYSAALQSHLPWPILDIYECAVIRRDPAWYSEKGGLSRQVQHIREGRAVASAMPRLSNYLDDLGIEAYVSAPIVSDAAWKKYYGGLSVFEGSAVPTLHLGHAKL